MPPILIDILKKSGYDHSVAVKQLDAEKLNSIETFARDNLANILQKDSTYSNSFQTFRFLPGHRATLLALPALVDEYISSASTNITDLSSDESKEQLRKSLINKLEKFANSISLTDFTLSLDNLESWQYCTTRNNNTTIKCMVKCYKCDIKVPCTFKNHWQVSNFQKHLKNKHKNTPNSNDNHQEPSGSSNNKKQNKQNNSNILRGVNNQNAKEIESLISLANNSADDSSTIPLSDSFEKALKLNNNVSI